MRGFKAFVLCGLLTVGSGLAQRAAASEWATTCDDAAKRCTIQSGLVAENGKRAGTIGVQIGRDRSDAVLFVSTPLGVELPPGLRARSGQTEYKLAFEVCFPDGCRARALLDAASLPGLLELTQLDLLMFVYGDAKPVALSVPLDGLKAGVDKAAPLP